VLPQRPDAWLWLGDMAYLDVPPLDCAAVGGSSNAGSLACTCATTWLRHPPQGCYAGDMANALRKMRGVLESDGYTQLLEYLCPGHTAANQFPPAGRDPSVCPRPILGTYDDHDYGWNNGDRRLPNRDAMKNVFLDAIGEARDSVRRNSARGIYDWQQLGAGMERVDVIMLDERYERAPMPCHVQRELCVGAAAGSTRKVRVGPAGGGQEGLSWAR